MRALPIRTYLKHYLVHDVVDENSEQIVYHAEDFQRSQTVLLTEYFPLGIAKRVLHEDGAYRVEADLGKENDFNSRKDAFLAVSETLLHFEHTTLLSVTGLFEANGTLYRVSKMPKADSIQYYFSTNTKALDEETISTIGMSLLRVVAALKNRHLALCLKEENVFLDKSATVIVSSSAQIVLYTKVSDSEIIYALGTVLYMLMTGTSFKEGDTLSTDTYYSAELYAIVNSMVSVDVHTRPKTVAAVQNILQKRAHYPEPSDDALNVSNDVKRSTPSFIRYTVWGFVASIMLVVLYSDKKVVNIEEVGFFRNIQLQVAAYMGIGKAQSALAVVYEKGYGVKRDPENAALWQQKARLNNNNKSDELYYKYMTEGTAQQKQEAYNYFLNSAKHGDIYAQYAVGHMLAYGKGVDRAPDKAIVWFKKALKAGYIHANYELGRLYFYNESDLQDYAKSYEYFYEGAQQHDLGCEMGVGYMYEMGYGVKKDRAEAYEWYVKAAKRGHIVAQYNLANALEKGRGTSVDLNRAKYWYSMAAEQGYQSAKKRLQRWSTGVYRR